MDFSSFYGFLSQVQVKLARKWKKYSAKAFGHVDEILYLKEKDASFVTRVLGCGLSALYILVAKNIFCTEPYRLPLSGKATICCFDKTGTLTDQNFEVKGVCKDKSIVSIKSIEEVG